MEHTEYHQLCLWDPEDRILREDFNADNAKTEAALADLTEAVAGCGNCKIEYGSYTGTGNYSSAHKNSLTFSSQPMLVVIQERTTGTFMILMRGCIASYVARSVQTNPDIVRLEWSANKVSWYCGSGADNQFNLSNQIYYYVAFIPAEE